MVQRQCRECGTLFMIERVKEASGRGIYCSRQCAGKGKARSNNGKTGLDKRLAKKSVLQKCAHASSGLQQSFSLDTCPWQEGKIPPVQYDADYSSMPDPWIGF